MDPKAGNGTFSFTSISSGNDTVQVTANAGVVGLPKAKAEPIAVDLAAQLH